MAYTGDFISGAKAIFSIAQVQTNGTAGTAKTIAYASNCSYTLNHNLQPVEAIGDPKVKEHAELGITVDFTCTMFRIYSQGAVELGIQPKLANILSHPNLVVTISTKDANDAEQTLVKVERVRLTGRSGTVDARGVWTETLTFVGRKFVDESLAG